MPKFAANLTMLFQEYDFLDRFEQAAQAGFDYVEYLFPYDYEPEQLKLKLQTNNLQQVLFNLPPGDWAAGERGIACLPDRIEEFKSGVERAITYATALGVKQINCLAGIKPDNLDESLAWKTMLDNVNYAADALSEHGITLLVEPINSKIDMPGFFIDTLDKAIKLIQASSHSPDNNHSNLYNRRNLKLQFDLYHMQIMHGDLMRRFEGNRDLIAHVQFADNPGRHEPDTGEINFKNIFQLIDKCGYEGWVSAEYIPSQHTKDSLTWLRTFN